MRKNEIVHNFHKECRELLKKYENSDDYKAFNEEYFEILEKYLHKYKLTEQDLL